MSYSPEAFVAELRTVLENVQTELSATGRHSARIQRCIDAMPSLAATLRQQAARVDEDAVERFKAAFAEHSTISPAYDGCVRAGLEAALSAQPAERQGECVDATWRIDTDDEVEKVAKAAGWDNRRYMTPADYAVWCNRMREFVRQAIVRPAAPVGVPDGDAAIGRAYKRWYAAAKGFRNVVADAAHAMILSEAERIAAAPSAPQGECKCSLRQRLVGDGCQVCNPELAAELAGDTTNPTERK